MTRRERVVTALSHKEVFPIPYHVDFTANALEKLIQYTSNPTIGEETGSYLQYFQYWGWPEEINDKPGHFLDEFGVLWNRSGVDKDIGVIENHKITDIENHNYIFPNCDIPRLKCDTEEMIASADDRFRIAGFGFMMFERAWSLMGMENALMAMSASPEKLEQLFELICDYFSHLLDVVLEYDIDGVYFGDDWGQQRGLIMGPSHWRRYIKPPMARLYEKVKSKNKFVIQHSCGDCHEIFPDLIDIGLDCYQTFQPEIYDLKKMKQLYGDKLSFWGGISVQQVLPRLNPDQVRTEIIDVARTLSSNGGYILAPSHALTYDIPPENILTMIDVMQNQEKYI